MSALSPEKHDMLVNSQINPYYNSATLESEISNKIMEKGFEKSNYLDDDKWEEIRKIMKDYYEDQVYEETDFKKDCIALVEDRRYHSIIVGQIAKKFGIDPKVVEQWPRRELWKESINAILGDIGKAVVEKHLGIQ